MELWTNCGTNSVTFFLQEKFLLLPQGQKVCNSGGLVKNFLRKQKSPWPQTKDRRSLVRLAWQSRSLGYFVDLLRHFGFRPTTSAGTFPTIRNTFFRDIKRFRLFVLSLYHICAPLKRRSAGNLPQWNLNKTEANRAFCYLCGTFSYLSACGWWESVFVCQRRAAILRGKKKDFILQNSCVSLCGQTFDSLRLALPVLGAPKGTRVPELYLFYCGFPTVDWEIVGKHLRPRACCSLP